MRISGVGLLFTAPVAGSISSDFGPRNAPTEGASTNHKGVDYPVAVGTPVASAAAGVVKSTNPQSGFGQTVVIDHGGGVTTLYGHLSQVLVSNGQQVDAGTLIALSGATGTVSGPNLHFQVMLNGTPVDPMQVLNAGGIDPVSTGGGNSAPEILPDGSVFSGGTTSVMAIAAVVLGVVLLMDVASGK